ncbi:SRPBCC family protein [Epidermidibacterium keratini]|uniref:SRPBCC family protein n=1 Tax=Epidermidibacterium keratini TaxID=1891644 RepID=A0A7L4YT62_9ACTN|nr:SRPBCC family protein [Epidermidibacterium keratini]QHC01717.1 SRPBCC family protein [Epidermidibacterium keratini]
MTFTARHISQPIARPPAEVIAFAGNPQNLPRWAAGLSEGIRQDGERWVTESPMGTVEVSFTGPVDFGVLDHDVRLPDGSIVHNPLRVLANDDGSEVVFTLYERPGMPAEEFERDAEMVRADLKRLRAILES